MKLVDVFGPDSGDAVADNRAVLNVLGHNDGRAVIRIVRSVQLAPERTGLNVTAKPVADLTDRCGPFGTPDNLLDRKRFAHPTIPSSSFIPF